MTKLIQSYETPEVKVTFDPNVCIHSGNCVRGLPSVFNVKQQPWIAPGGATPAEVEAQVAKCPSGALRFTRK
ncbi:MAG: (4Fe-4S)-binding protein [Nevskiales bacterium]